MDKNKHIQIRIEWKGSVLPCMNVRSRGEHQSLSIRATTEEEADQSDSEIELSRSILPSKVPYKPVVCSFFLGELLCCSYTCFVASIWHQHVNILCISCSSWIDIIHALVALLHIIEHVMNPSAEYQVLSYKDDNSLSFVASSEQLVPIFKFRKYNPFPTGKKCNPKNIDRYCIKMNRVLQWVSVPGGQPTRHKLYCIPGYTDFIFRVVHQTFKIHSSNKPQR